jgi:hypothetical protein
VLTVFSLISSTWCGLVQPLAVLKYLNSAGYILLVSLALSVPGSFPYSTVDRPIHIHVSLALRMMNYELVKAVVSTSRYYPRN